MDASFEAAVQLFTATEESTGSTGVAKELTTTKKLVVLSMPLEPDSSQQRMLRTFLKPLVFLFRGRDDLTLVQTACKDIKLTVYNDGAQEVTITPENDLADSITQLIKFIGWSPDCPDATQLDNYVSSLNAEELLGDVKVFTVATGQRDYVANAANVSSIIWHAFLKVNRPLNWVGFYFVRPLKNPKSTEWAQILILGPFLGKPACSRIRYENGVCGASWRTKSLQRVANVHTFPGHIACDDASKSELVVPILNHHGEVVALIDLDCPKRDGFSIEDERTFKQVAQIMSEACDWENMNWPYVQL